MSESEPKSEVSGDLAFTNSSGETFEIAVKITDRESEERIWMDSYEIASSDDGYLREDVVTSYGSYDVEATIEEINETASTVWRLPSDDSQDYYAIRVHVQSDGGLEIVVG